MSQKLPQTWERQRLPSRSTDCNKLFEKVALVIERGYLEEGKVKNLTSYFAVPKGLGDIRVVYDASKSLLNSALWSPNFGLPTIHTVLRATSFESWFKDADLGEHFLNFPLDKRLRPYVGVDVTTVQRWIQEERIKQLKQGSKCEKKKHEILHLQSLLPKREKIIKCLV